MLATRMVCAGSTLFGEAGGIGVLSAAKAVPANAEIANREGNVERIWKVEQGSGIWSIAEAAAITFLKEAAGLFPPVS
jgi:hypothetical protein